MKFSNIIILSFTAILLSPLTSIAASYSVAPLIIDHELEKRDIVKEEITITNKSGKLIRIYPTVNEVSLGEDGGIETFVERSMVENKGTSITSWVEISRARIQIEPGESVTVPLTIHVNPSAEAGEYRAFIGFAEASNQPEAQKKVKEGIAQGTVLRISVDKVQNQFLRLDTFSVERFITEKEQDSITFALENPGSDPVVPAGEIIFYNTAGSEVYAIPINPDQQIINSNETAHFSENAPSDLPLGKYKAFLSVEYGEHLTASVHDTAFFYIFPIKFIVIIFVALLVISVLFALLLHRRDMHDDVGGVQMTDVPMYLRTERSESKDHDIDLSNKKTDV